MKSFSIFFSTFFVLFYRCHESLNVLGSVFNNQFNFKNAESRKNPDLHTMNLIGKLGYPAESHTVETVDGYILTLHRIPYSKESSPDSKSRRPTPVLLQHGLLGSSVDFFLISTGDALPLLLSDLGYDVWMGNVRGNMYSRKHKTLLPGSNTFWNYTWHEAALYDVPAMVDYILEKTEADKLAYIGHSMGSTMFLVLASTFPEYSRKIQVGLLMAPIAFASNMKSPLLRFLAPLSRSGGIYSNFMISGEFRAGHPIIQMFTKYLCALPKFDEVFCRKFIHLVFGVDYNNFNPTTVPLLLDHYPAGLSTKAVNHYAQLLKSGKFQQYDYGSKLNNKEYGLAYPPEYDLKSVNIPTYFYAGKNDFLAPLEDVNYTAQFVGSLKKNFIVDDPAFTHLDFLAGIDVRSLLYKPLIKHMMAELAEGE